MEVYTCDSDSYVVCYNLAFLMLDLYTKSPAAHLMRTGAVKQDLNGEIHLYKKFWNEETDNKTVPAILIYADLMGSGNSRCLEAAQRILENELKDFE